ncbi:acetyl-CoA hydrolase [Acrocarpospora pleiomorpha]|uniref:Acetyl-CoA hydrolase n=2 Tax=Acrocarpospora pleiomorpha TaxID=90975 RepID=A0A5M3XGS8_9ACTN|nr:acetyl-CoA hydrolase [Acrocarpospora pleiomorpha]
MTISPGDAARELMSGLAEPVVLAAMSPQLPESLVTALIREARTSRRRLTLLIADLSGAWAFIDDDAMPDVTAGTLRLVTVGGGVPRRLARHADFIPNSLWDFDRLIRSGDLGFDIFVERVGLTTDPDHVTHGDMIGFSDAALATRARVGFEVARHAFPYPGAGGVPLRRAAQVIAAAPLVAPRPSAQPDAVQRLIADHVAALVPDGATLQLGLGMIPNAVIHALSGKSHLGIHSGILPGELQALLASGAVTGSRKGRDRGRHVATGILGGDPRGWGADVLLRPVTETHDPLRLRELDSLWAINSAFEIDLAGQVNAEHVNGSRVANGGGQTDFMRAAHANSGGAAVLALPARSRSGVSRIVGYLPAGHTVTTSGSDVDFVVTEHGTADFRGRSADERARALIGIAHPDDRPGLRAQWR